MKKLLGLLLLISAQAAFACTKYNVTDTLYDGGGNLLSGTVYVSNTTTFTTVDGCVVPAFSNVPFTITNGALAASLLPNAGSTPASFYSVEYAVNSGKPKELWVVPASNTNLAGVRVSAVPTINTMFAASQLVPPVPCTALQFFQYVGGSSPWGCSTISQAVPSVFGRTGAITAQAGDYSFSLISGVLDISDTPLTTFGDLLFANSTPQLARLPGNTSATRMFLSQTGNGSISASPAWLALQAVDIPDLSATYLKLTGGTLSGVTSFANGTAAAPGISFASSLGQGLTNLANTTTCVMGGGGAVQWLCLPNTAGAGAQIPATSCYGISSSGTAGGASSDTKFCRPSAGIFQIQATNGTTSGALMASSPVAAKTTNYTVTVLESGTVFHNTGAAGSVAFTLPASPTAGLTYTFVTTVAQNIVITANTGQTIRNGASVSSSAGTATNGTVGSTITIVCITATTWYVTQTPNGTWTLA
jgi:hypothetical protein